MNYQSWPTWLKTILIAFAAVLLIRIFWPLLIVLAIALLVLYFKAQYDLKKEAKTEEKMYEQPEETVTVNTDNHRRSGEIIDAEFTRADEPDASDFLRKQEEEKEQVR